MNSNIVARVREAIRNGEPFSMHRGEVGKVRSNCVYAKSATEVPDFLIEDGAITINEDGSLILYAVEGPAKRELPVYICWEKASEENKDKVPGEYGCWPKDNGDKTLKVIDGLCYNLPTEVTAILMTDELPEFVKKAGFPVSRNGDTWELTRTDWNGEVRIGTIGNAFWCQYGSCDVNILAITEPSAGEYIVTFEGKDIGHLTELV